MSIEEFLAGLSDYGPDLARWPVGKRADAEALLARSEYARQIHQVERILQKELRARTIKAPEGLVDRILGKAFGSRRHDPDKQ